MTTSSRSQRKRKQAEFFSPISRQEETFLMQALRTSLKEIPSDGSESEDNESSEDEEISEETGENDFIDEEIIEDKYELKWNKQLVQVHVADFNELSGPTKILSSRQNVKSFFELLWNKKVLHLVCSQTNIYAEHSVFFGHYCLGN